MWRPQGGIRPVIAKPGVPVRPLQPNQNLIVPLPKGGKGPKGFKGGIRPVSPGWESGGEWGGEWSEDATEDDNTDPPGLAGSWQGKIPKAGGVVIPKPATIPPKGVSVPPKGATVPKPGTIPKPGGSVVAPPPVPPAAQALFQNALSAALGVGIGKGKSKKAGPAILAGLMNMAQQAQKGNMGGLPFKPMENNDDDGYEEVEQEEDDHDWWNHPRGRKGKAHFKGKGRDNKGGNKGGDWECPNCGDNNFARNRECRKCQTARPDDGRGKGDREERDSGRRKKQGKEGGKGREPEHAFDLLETVSDLCTMPHLPKTERLMLARAIEQRLTNEHFEKWLGVCPEGSVPRTQLVAALDDNMWGFSRVIRASLLEVLTEKGFDFAEWKEKSDSVGGNQRARGDREGGKGKDGKGRKGKKGKKGRRDKDYRDPDDPLYEMGDEDNKTGANIIEVKWKPPGAKDTDDEAEEEEKEKEKSPSPVRGPAGRGMGNAKPAWMEKGIGNTSAPEPEKKESSGPAGRGRGTAVPMWMVKGVSDAPPPSIPDMSNVDEAGKQIMENPADKPHILDSIFEERDATVAHRRRSRSRGRKGKKGRRKGGEWPSSKGGKGDENKDDEEENEKDEDEEEQQDEEEPQEEEKQEEDDQSSWKRNNNSWGNNNKWGNSWQNKNQNWNSDQTDEAEEEPAEEAAEEAEEQQEEDDSIPHPPPSPTPHPPPVPAWKGKGKTAPFNKGAKGGTVPPPRPMLQQTSVPKGGKPVAPPAGGRPPFRPPANGTVPPRPQGQTVQPPKAMVPQKRSIDACDL